MRIQTDLRGFDPQLRSDAREQIDLSLGRYADTIQSVSVSISPAETRCCRAKPHVRCIVELSLTHHPEVRVATEEVEPKRAMREAIARCERTLARQLAVSRLISADWRDADLRQSSRRPPIQRAIDR